LVALVALVALVGLGRSWSVLVGLIALCHL
jgi:hypothetical protein